MKKTRIGKRWQVMVMVMVVGLAAARGTATAQVNQLSEREKAEGWMLLFDGKTLNGWRCYRQKKVSDGWQVREGSIVRVGRAGNLMTAQQFENFELSVQWKICPNGNSGIMFRVTEDQPQPYFTGPEYQILDNQSTKYADAKIETNIAGSNYALHASDRSACKPAGQWNQTRLVVNGHHVEHWLNGKKVVSYELLSPQWLEMVAKSKYRNWPHYGRRPRGHIVFQDHGDEVAFRDIKIRPLPPTDLNRLSRQEQAEGWQLLFDGKTTAGWRGYKQPGPPAHWKVEDGALVCDGKGGDLMTDRQYGSFELTLQWKISPGGNSGILYWVTEQGKMPWHTGPEYQLLDSYGKSGDLKHQAGANYDLQETDPAAFRPAGLWNDARIVIQADHVEHWLNGVKVCQYERGSPQWEQMVKQSKFRKYPQYGRSPKGHIALQEHGHRVWFRHIKLKPLDEADKP